MAISQTMNNALSGLRAATWGTNVVSSNLANAMTEGYGVRRVTLAARDLNGLGAGVQVTGVQREVDPYLIGQRRLSDAALGHDQTLSAALNRLESLFEGDGVGGSLGHQVTAVETALSEASADPSSGARLNNVAYRLMDLTDSLDTASHGIRDLREAADQQIGAQVRQLNAALEDVDRLNDEIIRTRKGTGELSGLIDQRQQVIDSISDLVPVRTLNRAGGRVALMTTAGEVLLDHRPREVGFQVAGPIPAEASLAGGQLHGLTIDGRPVTGGGAAGHLAGGAIAANLAIRDEVMPQYQSDLDGFANHLFTSLSDPAVDSTITGATGGLLVLERPSNPALPAGIAGELKLNPALHPDTGDPWRLRSGMGAPAAGDVGDPTLLQGWAEALSSPRGLFPGQPDRRMSAHIAALGSEASGQRIQIEDRLSRAAAVNAGFTDREKAMGVDTDTELQNLMVLEKAYAANARVIQVADSLLRNLLEI